MDDSFAFAGRPDPRRMDPWVRSFGIGGLVVLLVIGGFAGWAIASERKSFHRLRATAPVVAPVPVAVLPNTVPTSAAAQSAAADQARRAAFAALRAAKAVNRTTRSYEAAGPAALTAALKGAVFVDGPSSAPDIVSVATARHSWAAAVLASDGICYYVKIGQSGALSFGTGSSCTGADAMATNGAAG